MAIHMPYAHLNQSTLLLHCISIFLVKYRHERHKRRQGCFYYASTDMISLTSIITTQQLFSPLKSTVRERQKEQSFISKARENERDSYGSYHESCTHIHYSTFYYQVESKRTRQLWMRACIRHTFT